MPESGMLEAALAYAARGWPVFPVSPADARPRKAFGPRDATLDKERIAAHWRRMPGDMIGVALGPKPRGCGCIALALNPPPGESAMSALLMALHNHLQDVLPLPPKAPLSRSPGGGAQIWLAWPEGDTIEPPARTEIIDGAAALGDGGWAVVPPSRRKGKAAERAGLDGRAYEWQVTPFAVAPPPPSPRLLAAIDEGRPLPAALSPGERDPLTELLKAEPLNDTGNAQRLLKRHGRDFVTVRHVGLHWWTGTHWELEGGRERVQAWAQDTAALIAEEGRAYDADGDFRSSEARFKFGVSAGNSSRIAGMIAQAAPHRTVAPELLDADPLAINVANGTLRARAEEIEEADIGPDPDSPRAPERRRAWRIALDPHRREDLCAKAMAAAHDPDARCPLWRRFLARVQPREAVREFLQRFHGYALTGLTAEQVFVYHYGTGANGKTTFIEAIARLMGPYAQPLPPESLAGDLQRRGDSATPDFARLPGARLVRCAEMPRGHSFRESTIKLLTGGEPMLVRHLNERFFEMWPVFKAIGSGNERPAIGGVDEGIWRRMKLVPWLEVIPLAEQRPMAEVLAELAAEASGILNWLIDGLLDYLAGGLRVPAEIVDATAAYRADSDPVGEFTDACVAPLAGHKVAAREVFRAYVAWCHASSVRAFSEKAFANIMTAKGYAKQRGAVKQYLDIALHDVPADPDADSRQGRFEP